MSAPQSISRRGFLSATALGAGLLVPVLACAQIVPAELRGSLDATKLGVRPGALDDQSIAFQDAINAAARAGQALYLPAGDYLVSNIDLPSGLTMIGIPGRTRIRYAGDGHLMFATQVANLHLEGLVLDGENRPLADYAPALLHISTGAAITVENCTVLGSAKNAVTFDRVAGRLVHCTISGARRAALVSNDAQGLALRDNIISDCAENGILVHRWSEGRDATLVTGNRVERIRAASGGTGLYGNGIHVFRAADVLVSGNSIDDCDFSAIRLNASSNVIISDNQCHRAGEIAVVAEFGSQGAIVTNNIIDEAATGISVTRFNEGGRLALVQGNLVRNLSGRSRLPTGEVPYGSGITVQADASVIGNVVEDATRAGISAGWGPYLRNVIVSQNIIRRADIGVSVSVVDGVETTIISGNIIEATPSGAVVGMRWLERATGDLTQGRTVPAPLVIENNQKLS